MRSIIVCASIHHGNTLKLAKAIAEILEARIAEPSEADPREIAEYDLAGFGSGIYYGRHHETILKFAERLPRVHGLPAFVFSTSGLPRIPLIHDYHKPLIEILEGKGFRVLGEFTCRGYSTHGPLRAFGGINRGRPDDRDLERARRFAEEILEKLEELRRSRS